MQDKSRVWRICAFIAQVLHIKYYNSVIQVATTANATITHITAATVITTTITITTITTTIITTITTNKATSVTTITRKMLNYPRPSLSE